MLGRSGVEGNKRGLAPGNGGSRGGPRDTRFRYPGQVSGLADEEICLRGYGNWWWVGGRGGCYRGLWRSALDVWMSCTLLHAETTTHFAGLDRNRTRSSRRIEEPKWAATGGLRATVA
ncbi:s-adenosylmethionine decarboxylase [Alternaria alternata]|nr:s-adenosylmethionine decarboxylase [Alternaria alternata]